MKKRKYLNVIDDKKKNSSVFFLLKFIKEQINLYSFKHPKGIVSESNVNINVEICLFSAIKICDKRKIFICYQKIFSWSFGMEWFFDMK